jgi:glycerate kinase
MRILIASDKFKGSLSAPQVAGVLRRVLERGLPGVVCDLCPIADGGEGTVEAMTTALGGQRVETATLDAQGRALRATYGLVEAAGERLAVLEMSAASGLALVQDLPLEPATANTVGTGRMMQDALRQGAGRLVIGIGGSATNDAGTGMAAALGWSFLDDEGRALPCLPRDLDRLAHIVPPASPLRVAIQVACDVDNPLLGPQGCTRIYGPQKGVQDFAWHEARLERLAATVRRDLGVVAEDRPGAGAAGGLGYGLMVFCGAQLVSGFDLIASAIRLQERMAAADLVITGEGRLDAQTLHGKGPVGVAQMARALGKKVAAFAGSVEDTPALRAQFDLARAIKPETLPLPEAIARAEELLERAVMEALPDLRRLLPE